MTEPNYVRALREHLRRFGTTGGVVHVEIRHDDDCGVFDGRRCDCEPEVEIVEPDLLPEGES